MSYRLINRRIFSGALLLAPWAASSALHAQGATAMVGQPCGRSVKYKDQA